MEGPKRGARLRIELERTGSSGRKVDGDVLSSGGLVVLGNTVVRASLQ